MNLNKLLKQELQSEIDCFINNLSDQDFRDRMYFVFCGDGKIPKWGSLARGSLFLALSNSGNYKIARSIELIHHASLIVDDFIDKAKTRRGFSTFWVKYGYKDCILFSHMMIILALEEMTIQNKNLISFDIANKSIFKTINTMISLEIKNKDFNDMQSYIDIVDRKTGKFYGLVGLLAGLTQSSIILNKDSCVSTLEKIGVSHQMLDDFIDSNYESNQVIFDSSIAKEENRRKSIYHLLEFGYTKEQLNQFHKQYSLETIEMLESNLYTSPNKWAALELCKEICFGNHCQDFALNF